MDIQKFNFNHNELSVIVNENGNPLFIAKEATDILGYRNASDAVRQLDDDEKLLRTLPIAGQNRAVNVITESGLYTLIMRSNKPEAKPFKKWVTREVLPTIRKHGAYMTQPTLEKVLNNPDLLIGLANKLKDEVNKNERLEQINALNTPKVIFADAVSASSTSILVGEMAKILKQNNIDMGQNRLFSWLRSEGYLIKRKGCDFNMPTQVSMNLGLFEIKETSITHSDGFISVSKTSKVTGKGQVYFTNKFLQIK